MHAEAAFLAGYAVVLLVVAAGLERLGRRPTDPWSSRMLAASPPPGPPPSAADWPHSEVPQLHLGLSGVALAAALLLTAVSVVRHHAAVELLVQLAVLTLTSVQIARLVARARAPRAARRSKPGPGRNRRRRRRASAMTLRARPVEAGPQGAAVPPRLLC